MGEQPETGREGLDFENAEHDGWRTFSGWLWVAYLAALLAGAALLL